MYLIGGFVKQRHNHMKMSSPMSICKKGNLPSSPRVAQFFACVCDSVCYCGYVAVGERYVWLCVCGGGGAAHMFRGPSGLESYPGPEALSSSSSFLSSFILTGCWSSNPNVRLARLYISPETACWWLPFIVKRGLELVSLILETVSSPTSEICCSKDLCHFG